MFRADHLALLVNKEGPGDAWPWVMLLAPMTTGGDGHGSPGCRTRRAVRGRRGQAEVGRQGGSRVVGPQVGDDCAVQAQTTCSSRRPGNQLRRQRQRAIERVQVALEGAHWNY